jgi:primosomal protein N' (replication factor Y)
VLVDLDARSLDRRTFSYRIPEGMEESIDIGTPVSVPFGRMKRLTGYVVGFTNYVEPGIRVKDIIDILDEEPLFDLEYLNFLDWTAQYYATPLIQVISAALPTSLVAQTRREVVLDPLALKSQNTYALSRPAQQILAFLRERPQGKGVRVRYVASQTGLPLKLVNQTLYKLKQDGFVSIQNLTKNKVGAKVQRWIRLVPDAPQDALTKRQKDVITALAASNETEWLLADAALLAQTTPATLQKMASLGVMEVFESTVNRARDPLSVYEAVTRSEPFTLNDEQCRVRDVVMASDEGSEHVMFGITGSGKTEVYIALTQAMLKQGKSVLVMVPEISLTSHIAKRFIQKFGLEHIALWHSQLAAGEKVDTWRRVHNGELKIVIGARSAIFTPMNSLGLIIMDEFHEGSFKQDSPAPRYNAQTLAGELRRRSGAKLLLGSATPDIETYYQAKKENRILTLTQRYGGRSLATVDVVDMRKRRQYGGSGGAISDALKDALVETVTAGQQAIILLNRRGFYTLITCKQCEEVFQCTECSVALTYHRYKDKIRCHYCGFEGDKPQYCPHCASFDLGFTGLGTQRLEDELQEALPHLRILRLDSDVMQKKFAHREVFEAFERHEADVLIGTQMVAKGLDVGNVTLVGVVSADLAFSLPDYKSAERGFQLLTQVAGRAGRGAKPGRVIIQTMSPDHPVVQRARNQDFLGFYDDEMLNRNACEFPPFSQLFRIIVSCTDEFKTRHFIEAATSKLRKQLEDAGFASQVSILGPAPCLIGRIQGRFRYHVMIKNRAGAEAHQLITSFYNSVETPEDINFLLDVDAQSFL